MTPQFHEMNLHPQIMKAVDARGYKTPTPIQAESIPYVMEGRDVLGIAQTGTGKTAAFLLPILHRLVQGPKRRTRALIVAPTRELAEQIREEATQLSKMTRLKSISVYGGVGKGPQLQGLRSGAEIVVACPGRLLDLMRESGVDFSHVETLVLDEADRMCDMGFLPDVRRILKQLPPNRQTLFYSATMPREARELADKILRNPATVQIGIIKPAKTVSHAIYPVPQKDKKTFLFHLLDRTATGRVLIFTRTKYRARNLARDMGRKGYRTAALQGNMSQKQRQNAITGFRGGKFDFLVATDVASRGIDVTDISHVINFDMPDTVDAYTHRIGRTGRADQSGEALTFFTTGDDALLRNIEKTLGESIEQRRFDDFNYSEVVEPKELPKNNNTPKSKQKPGKKNRKRYRGSRSAKNSIRRR